MVHARITHGASASKDLPDGHNYTLRGSIIGQGLSNAGQGKGCGCGCGKCNVKMGMGNEDIKNLLKNKIIPNLLHQLKIPKFMVPPTLIDNILDKALANNADLKTTIQYLTKALMPLLGTAKMKSLGLPISGSGFYKLVNKKKKNALMGHLSKGLYNTIHKGKGLKLAGQGFWDDFYSGFKSVFKPFATIAGPIASALGVPELGIPLAAIGSAM